MSDTSTVTVYYEYMYEYDHCDPHFISDIL